MIFKVKMPSFLPQCSSVSEKSEVPVGTQHRKRPLLVLEEPSRDSGSTPSWEQRTLDSTCTWSTCLWAAGIFQRIPTMTQNELPDVRLLIKLSVIFDCFDFHGTFIENSLWITWRWPADSCSRDDALSLICLWLCSKVFSGSVRAEMVPFASLSDWKEDTKSPNTLKRKFEFI